MGSDFVIAVAIEESMHSQKELKNPLNMADQVTSIPIRNVTAVSKSFADFVISPNMDGFSSKDFSHVREMIYRGYQAALDSIPALTAALKKTQATYHSVTIQSVTYSPADEEAFIAPILVKHVVSGKTVSFAEIAWGIEELWDTGRYFRIDADVNEQSGNLSLEVTRTPGRAVIRIPGDRDDSSEETAEEVSSEGDGRFSMHALIERINARVRLLRTGNSRSTFATIIGEELNDTRDTLRVNVAVPRLTGIFIEKNLKSRRYQITREIDMEIGEPFDLKKAMNSVENLYGTNLFEHVYADVSPYEGGVGFSIRLKEKNWSVVRLGIKYDEFNATEGRVNFSRDNMFGLGSQMNATLQTGQRTKMFIAENRNDRVYKWMYTFNLRAYKHLRIRPLYNRESLVNNYEDDRYGVIFSVGQVMGKLGNVMVQLKSETSLINYPPSLLMAPQRVLAHVGDPIKNSRHEYRSVIVRSLIDSYDRYPFPRNGVLNIIYIENAGKVFGGTERFVKIFWGSTVTKTFSRRHTVTGSLSLGTADPSLPLTESFALGGSRTRLDCYNPDTAASLFFADFAGLRHEQKVGSRLAAGSLSYRLFIPRYFYLELLYGAGNVWKSGETIKADSLLQCYGVKGTFDTYIGQLTFGWGITSRGEDRLYMSAGREF
jgi:outer membrane protein assembly factor BamA